jgi:hypothetical protein
MGGGGGTPWGIGELTEGTTGVNIGDVITHKT